MVATELRALAAEALVVLVLAAVVVVDDLVL